VTLDAPLTALERSGFGTLNVHFDEVEASRILSCEELVESHGRDLYHASRNRLRVVGGKGARAEIMGKKVMWPREIFPGCSLDPELLLERVAAPSVSANEGALKDGKFT
jgi:hypothetical protein